MEHSTEQQISTSQEDRSMPKRIASKLDGLLSQADDFNKFLHNKKKKNEKRVKEMDEEGQSQELPNEVSYLVRQPTLLKKDGGKLKDYQLEALNWMISLMEADLNGILADDMGLGKTIQTIAFLSYLTQFKDTRGPHIIIAPLTTLRNWMNELQEWFPSCKAVLLLATQKQRKQTYQTHIKHGNFDVIVTSFQGVSYCFDWLRKIKWKVMVVDEAHKIKNDQAMISRELRMYSAEFKLLLTGTPLSNDLHELWSLLNFILPKIFEDQSIFDEIFGYVESLEGPEKQAQQVLIAEKVHWILSPYMKRRTKKEVETTLPPKHEKTLYITLTPLQVTMYRNYIKYRNPTGKSINIYKNGSMQMRKICCHPYLFPDIQPKNAELLGTHLISTSGKMQVLDKLLLKLLPQQHKVLIFSQFTTMLDILEDYCAFRQYKVCRIDGSIGMDQREKEITRFKTDPECQIFLLSTKSGGLGINLVAADVVIIYDMDWNPQNDNQAMDRAYRIGQTKPVHVYKFICEHTVEERMSEVQKTKLIWDDLVIQKGAIFMKNQPTIKATDIERMAKLGLGEIFRFDGGVTDQDIDQIIRLGEEKDQQKLTQIRQQLQERIKQQMGNIAEFNPYASIGQGKSKDSDIPDKDYDEEIQNYLNNRRAKQIPKKTTKRVPEFQLYPQRSELDQYISRLDDATDKYKAQLEEKITKIKERGFPNWSEQDFDNFVQANQRYDSKDYASISGFIKTKTPQQVEAYSKQFFRSSYKFPELKKHMKKISTAQDKIYKHNKQRQVIKWKRNNLQSNKYILPKIENYRRKYIDSLIAKYILEKSPEDIDGLHQFLEKDIVLSFALEPVPEKKVLPKKIERIVDFMEKEWMDQGKEKRATRQENLYKTAVRFFMKKDKMEQDNMTVMTETKPQISDEEVVVKKIAPKDKKTTQPKPPSKAKSKGKDKKSNKDSLGRQNKIVENSQENE